MAARSPLPTSPSSAPVPLPLFGQFNREVPGLSDAAFDVLRERGIDIDSPEILTSLTKEIFE